MLAYPELASLLLLILFVFLIVFFSKRAKEDRVPGLRPIAAFEAIKALSSRAIETGKKLHLSLGTGGLINHTTADTLAGLSALDGLAAQFAAAETPPIVTTADPATMLLAQNTLRKAYGDNHQGALEAAAQVRWISTQPAAYAAGVMSVLALDELSGNVMLGRFGDEYLLMGESAHKQDPPLGVIAGASDPNVLPYVLATSSDSLWGEEIFAAGAYLSKKPTHIGSLLAQDTLRWILAIVILGGVLLKAFGL